MGRVRVIQRSGLPKGILYSETPGAMLGNSLGQLLIKSGGDYLPVAPGMRTIVLSGPGTAISTAALELAAEFKIEVLLAAPGHLFAIVPNTMAQSSRAVLKLRTAQWSCLSTRRKSAEVARAVLTRKIASERHAHLDAKWLKQLAAKASSHDRLRHIEAQGAALYWRRFKGFGLKFKVGTPAEWLAFDTCYIARKQGRLGELAAQLTTRAARTPMQAMINFASGIIAMRVTRAAAAFGFDLAFGFLHNGHKPGRLSLVWDLVELFWADAASAVFKLAGARTFSRADFEVTRDRLQLAPGLCKEVALVVIAASPVSKLVRECAWLSREITRIGS